MTTLNLKDHYFPLYTPFFNLYLHSFYTEFIPLCGFQFFYSNFLTQKNLSNYVYFIHNKLNWTRHISNINIKTHNSEINDFWTKLFIKTFLLVLMSTVRDKMIGYTYLYVSHDQSKKMSILYALYIVCILQRQYIS